MTEDLENNDPPLLPYYPPPAKTSEVWYQVSVFLMLTTDESPVREKTKKTAQEQVRPNGRDSKMKLSNQKKAQSKLAHFEATLREAKRTARLACEEEPENMRYREHLFRLEQNENFV